MIFLLIIIGLILLFAFRGASNLSVFNINGNKQAVSFKNNIVDIIYQQRLLGQSDSLALRNIKDVINRGEASLSMLPPVNGFITQGIDTTNNHNGIDIISHKGDNIKSALDGVVVFSGVDSDLGNSLIISHPYSYFTIYGHCDSILVNQRDVVKRGQVIATVGESGIATAPHLHFEVWYNNIIIDPREIIDKYGDLDVSTK